MQSRRSLLVHLPDARRPPLLHGRSAEEGQGAALRSREAGRARSRRSRGSPTTPSTCPFSNLKFAKNDARVRVRRPGPARRRDRRRRRRRSRRRSILTRPPQAERRGRHGRNDPQQQGQRGAGPGAAARTPPRNRTLRFEYDMASGKVTLNEDYVAPAARPRWATLSPDEQTVIFARNHNLYMMDAANYRQGAEERQRRVHRRNPADDRRRGVLQLRPQVRAGRTIRSSSNSSRISRTSRTRPSRTPPGTTDKNARAPSVNIIWSPDSKQFTLTAARRAQGQGSRGSSTRWPTRGRRSRPTATPCPARKTSICPRCTCSTSRRRSASRSSRTASRTRACRSRRAVHRAGARGCAHARRRPGSGRAGRRRRPGRRRPAPAFRRSGSARRADKIYFTRLSRDMKKLDVCVADATTGDVKTLIEERLNTYIESRPLRLSTTARICCSGRSATAGGTTTSTTRPPAR